MSTTSMNKMICRMALALAVVSLAGCGLKGPLYFPKQEQTRQPVSSAKAAESKNASGAAHGTQQPSTASGADQHSAQ